MKCSNTLLREIFLSQKSKCDEKEKKNQELSEKYSQLKEEYVKVKGMMAVLLQKSELKNKDIREGMCDERPFGGFFGPHGGPGIF